MLTVTALIAFALLSALAKAGGADAAAAAVPQDQIAPYSRPQLLAHLERGRVINIVCLGHGSPTVILSAGLGNWSLTWRLVQRPLAERTRVCAWDRAGYGFSSPSPEPQDIVHTTEDLERALASAGIQGPYVMVAHSLGAYEALRFTDLRPQSIVGMVLVDPAIPDQAALEERIAPLFATKARALDERDVQRLQRCASELRGGLVKRGTPQFEQCTAASAVPAIFPRLQAAISRLNADPARLLTQSSTVREFDSDAARDSREVINGQRRYGDMPLIVLTGGRDESSLGFLISGATSVEAEEFHKQVAQYLRDAWVPGHAAYAALSTRGRSKLVPDSGHGIQSEKPDVVISAVIEVLDDIRQSALHKP